MEESLVDLAPLSNENDIATQTEINSSEPTVTSTTTSTNYRDQINAGRQSELTASGGSGDYLDFLVDSSAISTPARDSATDFISSQTSSFLLKAT